MTEYELVVLFAPLSFHRMNQPRPQRLHTPVGRLCRALLVWAPLVAMPFMLNFRWDALAAPNEEPKWAVFVLLGLTISLAGAVLNYLTCRDSSLSHHTEALRLTLPGSLLALFCVGLALGVTYAVNSGAGLNRLAFWCAGCAVFSASAWAMRWEASYPRLLQSALAWSALLLCMDFWYGFFVDFPDPAFNKQVQFSRIGHFNFTADVLMVLIPLLAWTVCSAMYMTVRVAAGISLVTAGFMLVLSGSLGGMGGLGVGGAVAAGLGLSRWMAAGDRRAVRLEPRIFLIGAGMALMLILSARLIIGHIPQNFREAIFVHGEWAEAPQVGDLDNAQLLPPLARLWTAITPWLGSRTPMWAATAGMVEEHPWRGVGTGGFLYEYPGYSKRYDLFTDFETLGVRIKTNPHNVLLQIAADNGLPMALLFAGLYGWLTLRVMRQAWQEEPSALWLCGVWALWAAALDAQVNHVFFNPASLFMAAVGFGLLRGGLPLSKPFATLPLCPLWRTPVAPVLAAATALWLVAQPLRWVVSQYYVTQATWLASSQSSAASQSVHQAWATALAWSPDNTEAIYGLATAYYPGRLTYSEQQGLYGFRSIKHPEQLSMLEKFQLQYLKLSSSPAYNLGDLFTAENRLKQFLKLSPYHSAALNLLGTLQARQGRLDEAEQNIAMALRLEPEATTIRENFLEIQRMKAQLSNKPGHSQ